GQSRPPEDAARGDPPRVLRRSRHHPRLHRLRGVPADVGAGEGHRGHPLRTKRPQRRSHGGRRRHVPARGEGAHRHRRAARLHCPCLGRDVPGAPAGPVPLPGDLRAAPPAQHPAVEVPRDPPEGVRRRTRTDHPGPAHRRGTRPCPRVPGGPGRPGLALKRQPPVDRRRRLPGGPARGLGHPGRLHSERRPTGRHALDPPPSRHRRRNGDRAPVRRLQPPSAGGRVLRRLQRQPRDGRRGARRRTGSGSGDAEPPPGHRCPGRPGDPARPEHLRPADRGPPERTGAAVHGPTGRHPPAAEHRTETHFL
ncbi:MAG: FIG00389819: hypothetical protein, partial [uncultured Arthrobacter sp.]